MHLMLWALDLDLASAGKHAGQDGNDRYDHQQFDEGEPVTAEPVATREFEAESDYSFRETGQLNRRRPLITLRVDSQSFEGKSSGAHISNPRCRSSCQHHSAR